MPFFSNNNTTAVVNTFSAATARGDSKESAGSSPPVTTSRGVVVVMTRVITVSVLLAMQLVMMDAAVFTLHALSSNPALLVLGLLNLLGSTGLMARCIIELQMDSDSPSGLRQATLLILLGHVVGTTGYGFSTHFTSALSYWVHLAIPSFLQTNTITPFFIDQLILGLILGYITPELDAYHILLAVAAGPTILPIWYLGGVTPAAVQYGLMIPSGASITLGGLGVAIGCFRLVQYLLTSDAGPYNNK